MTIKAKFGVAAVALLCVASQSYAAGCAKGAAVGGVGGHFVGKGHAVAGAAAGCAIGHHEAAKKAKQDAAAKDQAQKGAPQQGQ
jgi:hypothetical protein